MKRPKPADAQRAVIGALRSAINDHGPITKDRITSAAKRIVGNLKNVPMKEIQRAPDGIECDLKLLRISIKYWAEIDAQLRPTNVFGHVSMLQRPQGSERKLYLSAARACRRAAAALADAGLGSALRVSEEKDAVSVTRVLREAAERIAAKASGNLPVPKHLESERRYLFSRKRTRGVADTAVIRYMRWIIDNYARASGVALGRGGSSRGAAHSRNVVAAKWATQLLGVPITADRVATACGRASKGVGERVVDPWLDIADVRRQD